MVNREDPHKQFTSRFETTSPINELIQSDIRHAIFRAATRFIDYELIEGDIFEFGVYTGRSLAQLCFYHELNKKDIHKVEFKRRIIGFDSFEGLPASEGHPRWKPGLFSVNHSYHPLCKKGEKVSPSTIYSLFDLYNLPVPSIEAGIYERTLPLSIGKKYTKAAIIHIDCDLYVSTKLILSQMDSILQEGTILLFDDWFNFKGRRDKGEQRAFYEYASFQKKWTFLEYQTYATFGKSFIACLL